MKAYRESGRKAPRIFNLGGGGARIEHYYFSWVNTRSRCDFAGHKDIQKGGDMAPPVVSLGTGQKWSASRSGCISPKDKGPVSVFLSPGTVVNLSGE